MTKQGRPANVEPKTAFDVRRYMTLVQVIANSSGNNSIRKLCEAWGVEIVEDRSIPPYQGRYYLNEWATLIKLAQHVIEYHHTEDKQSYEAETQVGYSIYQNLPEDFE